MSAHSFWLFLGTYSLSLPVWMTESGPSEVWLGLAPSPAERRKWSGNASGARQALCRRYAERKCGRWLAKYLFFVYHFVRLLWISRTPYAQWSGVWKPLRSDVRSFVMGVMSLTSAESRRSNSGLMLSLHTRSCTPPLSPAEQHRESSFCEINWVTKPKHTQTELCVMMWLNRNRWVVPSGTAGSSVPQSLQEPGRGTGW